MPFRSCQHLDLGFTRRQLFDAVQENELRRLFRGVYVDDAVPDSRELRLRAIKLVTPPYAVVSDCSASWVYGVDAYRPSDRFLMTPSLVIPHGASRVRQRFTNCREAYIDPNDVTELDALLITTPVRTAADLLRRLWRPYALASADGLTRASLVTVDEIRCYVKGLRGFPRIVQARQLTELIDARAESPGESWTRLRISDARLPRPDLQIRICDPRGREIARLDLGYEGQRIAAEYDGADFHTTPEDRAHDEARRDYLREVAGWRFAIADKAAILGPDASFEMRLGEWLNVEPRLPRMW